MRISKELLDLLEQLAPEEPMNQDEQGGCVWCGGTPPRQPYAGADPKDHAADCPWVEARRIIEEARAAESASP